jgi:hypothetical protein
MNTTKKIILVLFVTMLVINLQFSTPLTHGMENGFSLQQLADNIFVPEAYATLFAEELVPCMGGGYLCEPVFLASIGCFIDMDYDCGWFPLY